MTAATDPSRTGLSRTAAGDPVPLAAERSRRHRLPEDPLVGWSASIGIALLAFVLRIWKVGTPNELSFDETYYAKDAWSLLNHGYVRKYVEDADDLILGGQTQGLWRDDPSMVVHPEVGKWLIALGEHVFGLDPTGWRVASVVVGSLMVLVMIRLVRRLTGSTLWGCVAGLLLCFDGLQFVLSRLALLDIFLAFFTLCAVHCCVADRQWFRDRLAQRVGPAGSGWGPVRALLWRPWLFLGGISFGLAIGTKWSALFVLAAFGVLVWLWSGGRPALVRRAPAGAAVDAHRRRTRVRLPRARRLRGLRRHLDRVAGRTPRSTSGPSRTPSTRGSRAAKPWPTRDEPDASGLGEVTQSLRSLAYYHHDVYVFHTHFLDDSDHTYESKPLGWLLLGRGVGVDADTDIQPGRQGCEAEAGSDCLRQVILLGTPVLWWGSVLALLASVGFWVGQRDWRFGIPVVGTLVTWLPWLANDDRPIFLFYAMPTLLFQVIACTLVLGKLVGPARGPTPRRTVGVIVAGSFVVLVLLNFAWFYPIYTDQLLTHREWLQRIWFTRWI